MYLFLPIIFEQFLGFLTGFTDSIMIAYVGESAVSGVSLVDFLIQLIISIFVALAAGGTIIAGQYLGRKDKDNANKAINQLVWLSLFVSLIIMGVIYLFKNILLSSLFGNISIDVLKNAEKYLMITAASIPFIAIYNSGAAIFRTMGNSKVSMKIMLVMNTLNAIGNAILIYIFKMGVVGAALPTLFSRIGAALIILSLLLNQKNSLYISKTLKYRFDKEIVKKIFRVGVPAGLENGMFYSGRIIVLSIVTKFGTTAIAANSIATTILMFEALPGLAINTGLMIIIARCIGLGDYSQAEYYTKKILKIIYLANLLVAILIVSFLPVIMKAYFLSEEGVILVRQIIFSYSIISILIWPLAYTLPVVFRSAGDVRYPMYMSIGAMLIFRILFAYILGVVFNMGLIGTWIAMYLDWLVKAIFFVIRYLNKRWTKFKLI